MLVVVDEFGSVLGLVTLADVLEAIAGDVNSNDSETSDEALPLRPEDDGSYVVSGGYPVDDLVEAMLLSKPAGQNCKTLAGLVLNHLQRLPDPGEEIKLLTLRVQALTVGRGRIETLRLTRIQG
jgi:CBS domain containing-hemolysin-like protein